ncbi:hypothetical protein Ancab_000386 [Ancistrocladus abbreviatus]
MASSCRPTSFFHSLLWLEGKTKFTEPEDQAMEEFVIVTGELIIRYDQKIDGTPQVTWRKKCVSRVEAEGNGNSKPTRGQATSLDIFSQWARRGPVESALHDRPNFQVHDSLRLWLNKGKHVPKEQSRSLNSFAELH